jgi:serine/threonine-protein kinase RsbW
MGENQSDAAKTQDLLLDSTLDSVDSAEQIALRVATEAGFEEEDLHKIGIAVRESMVNAVVHGNRYSLKKKVHLQVDCDAERLTITILDEGEGFDPNSLADPLAEENLLRQSGRGLLLMQAFVDEFHIRRAAPLGMEVKLIKYRSSK